MTRSALALPLAAACTLAIVLYPLLRAIQLLLYPEANPATVVWSAHAGYFWRAWIAAFGGGMAAFVVPLLGPATRARLLRALPMLAAAGFVLALAQAIAIP